MNPAEMAEFYKAKQVKAADEAAAAQKEAERRERIRAWHKSKKPLADNAELLKIKNQLKKENVR